MDNLFKRSHSTKELGRWGKECEGVVADFIDYFNHMVSVKVRGLKTSEDRDCDIGVIHFCLQSIESARTLAEGDGNE